MDGISYALRRVHEGENELAQHLLRIAKRYQTDAEMHHVARDLSDWSAEHVRRVAELAADRGLHLDEDANAPSRITETARAVAAKAMRRRPEPGLVLLEDLTTLYLNASENSIAWEMLAQVAQAKKDREILRLTEECHPQNLRQVRWANTMLKVQSPQVLASL